MSRTRVAHVILPRPDAMRPVLPVVWDAVLAMQGSAALDVEVLMPLAMRSARRWTRHAAAWPRDIEARLHALDPRPVIVPFLPLPHRSIEMAGVAVAAHLARRARDDRPHKLYGSFLDEGGYIATRAARLIGARSIAVAHGTDVRAARGELASPGRKRRAMTTVRHASRLIAVSTHLANELAQLGRRADLVRYSVPRDRFPLASGGATPEVLFVGTRSRDKGVDVLLEAFARLGRDDLTLRLVGPPSGDLDPRHEARRLGIAPRVRVDAELPQVELPRVYAAASCTVLPSRHEGFGIVLVESLLVGRPVVGSDVGGIRDIVTPDVGALAPAGDPRALAQAIDAVLARSFAPQALREHALPMTWESSAVTLVSLVAS